MLDRGQDLGWFDSGEIVVEAILSVVGFYFFFADAATTDRPFIPLRMFRDRNFALANAIMFLNGLILLATMALLTPFLQTLLGYPVLTSGYLLGVRGIGTLLSMMVVGRLLNRGVEPRGLMLVGWSVATYALWQMSGWNAETPARLIIVTSITQGAGLGLVFVPLQTVGYSTLPAEFRTHGAAMWTLIRNIGSSVGISLMVANLVNNTAIFHSQIAEFVTPFNDAMKLPDVAGQVRDHEPAGPRCARRVGDAAGGHDRLRQRLFDHGVFLADRLAADPDVPADEGGQPGPGRRDAETRRTPRRRRLGSPAARATRASSGPTTSPPDMCALQTSDNLPGRLRPCHRRAPVARLSRIGPQAERPKGMTERRDVQDTGRGRSEVAAGRRAGRRYRRSCAAQAPGRAFSPRHLETLFPPAESSAFRSTT